MARRHVGVAALGAAAVLTMGGSALAGSARDTATSVKLKDATLIVEVNATDGDAGLQVFLDGAPWKSMQIVDPKGRPILDVAAKARLDGYGLTELFSESSEPPFDVFPLEKFEELFPAGRYTFAGTTIEGKRLIGFARLSHDIPAGPRIVAPADDSRVGRSGVVARWRAVPEAAGVEIVGYRAIVTQEEPRVRVLNVDLPASARKVGIPSEFLQRSTEYKLEVQAIERSGNQTLTEVSFRTR